MLNIICIILLGSFDIYNTIEQKKEEDSTGFIIFFFIKKILSIVFYSIEDVIGKKVLLDDLMNINIYALLFYRAIVGTICLILFSIPFIFVEVTNKAVEPEESSIIFAQMLTLFKGAEFYKTFIFILNNFFYNIFIWLIIDKFSPSHYAISNIFESTGTLIRLWITESDSVQQPVIRLIIYLVLIFGSLIHAEMIVLNFCGMSANTNLSFEKKIKEEIDDITDVLSDNIKNEDRISINEDFELSLKEGNAEMPPIN